MNRTARFISLYYAIIFMSNSAYVSYIGVYYSEISLNAWQVGTLTAIAALLAVIVQPLWGIRSDRATHKNSVLLLILLGSMTLIWLVPLAGTHYIWIVVATMLFTLFHCAVNPLNDALTLELASTHRFRFSHIRTVGSIGFALMSLVAGWLIADSAIIIFPLFSILLFAAIILTPGLPKVKGHQHKGTPVRFRTLFADRKLVHLYVFTFVIQSTLAFFFAFHAIYSLEKGIGTALIGWGLMIGSFSQFPFMLYFDRLYQRFGIRKLLLFSGAIHGLRWLICAWYFTPQTLLFTWVLHGGTFILFYLCLAEYTNTHVREELKASAQMMNAVVIHSASKVFGSLLGGLTAYYFGLNNVFAMAGVLCLIAVAVFYLIGRKDHTNALPTSHTANLQDSR